ncbi:hypothetical protein GCK72_011500 [Caenorhabditis remanei]|uniref:Uncharacterized protein n=1 Tax=Caenorhabditis remanei TaxID=31234 RepID=A0A6A5H8W2_CAERE|nr:hypothetical protein GCK72_011500 [Caenorhabditis remanei]KAF1763234.1 hypothetical protein GCK72_011500 [Caenorhabditis remanei]
MDGIEEFLLNFIFEVITIFRHVSKYNSDLPLTFDKFIYNVYYFPYLWIISVYICNFTKIQNWIQNQKKRTPVTVVVPEYRVVRPQRIDETVISELSVSELETIFQTITILKTFLKYNSDLPLSFDKFIYNVYYFPYLWIISVYICNFTKIQIWIQNQKNRTSVTVVVPECRVVVRPQRIDETVISELSVSEVETVM